MGKMSIYIFFYTYIQLSHDDDKLLFFFTSHFFLTSAILTIHCIFSLFPTHIPSVRACEMLLLLIKVRYSSMHYAQV